MLPVLHVGFHNGGSTTLQGALFERHLQVGNLGEPHEDPSALKAMAGIWASCPENPRKRAPFDAGGSRILWQEALAKVSPGKRSRRARCPRGPVL